MSESLSDAVRDAAKAEVKRRTGVYHAQFANGAAWAVGRLPSDDDLFEVIHDAIPNLGIPHASMDGLYSEIAGEVRDAVSALMREKVSGPIQAP